LLCPDQVSNLLSIVLVTYIEGQGYGFSMPLSIFQLIYFLESGSGF
jgi:hypothetical protein